LPLLVAVDALQRYRAVSAEIRGNSLLDIGAGGKSFLSNWRKNSLSVDVRRCPGLDVVASASHLPFRTNSFDCVVAVDTIEHIPRIYRNMAVQEMKRVAKILVVIHAPIENAATYAGRRYDIAFNEWSKKVKGDRDRSTEEHIMNIEPSESELEGQGFALKGTHNADLWLSYMTLLYNSRWPLGMVASQFYHVFNRRKDSGPPFWGAVAVWKK
jgi:hypothetical protein